MERVKRWFLARKYERRTKIARNNEQKEGEYGNKEKVTADRDTKYDVVERVNPKCFS